MLVEVKCFGGRPTRFVNPRGVYQVVEADRFQRAEYPDVQSYLFMFTGECVWSVEPSEELARRLNVAIGYSSNTGSLQE